MTRWCGTVLIDYLRGRPVVARVAAPLERGITPATTSINVEEIVRGLLDTERASAERLCRGLVVLPITTEAAWLAGDWRRDHAARGMALWQADCLIAATSVPAGVPLTTFDQRDFATLELEVIHWPVGE